MLADAFDKGAVPQKACGRKKATDQFGVWSGGADWGVEGSELQSVELKSWGQVG